MSETKEYRVGMLIREDLTVVVEASSQEDAKDKALDIIEEYGIEGADTRYVYGSDTIILTKEEEETVLNNHGRIQSK